MSTIERSGSESENVIFGAKAAGNLVGTLLLPSLLGLRFSRKEAKRWARSLRQRGLAFGLPCERSKGPEGHQNFSSLKRRSNGKHCRLLREELLFSCRICVELTDPVISPVSPMRGYLQLAVILWDPIRTSAFGIPQFAARFLILLLAGLGSQFVPLIVQPGGRIGG